MFKNLILSACIYLTSAAHLPAEIVERQCKLRDPDLNSCILRRARELLPIFCEGIPSAGVPSFDPLRLKRLRFSTNETNVKIDAKFNEVTLIGQKSAIIKNFTLNPNTLKGYAIVQLPSLLMRANVEVKANINDYEVNNHAIYNWEFKDTEYKFQYQLKAGNIKNVLHYNIDMLHLLRDVGDSHLELESIDPGHQIQDSMTAATYNADPKVILSYMKRFVNKLIASFYKNAINNVLHKIPANEFLIQ